MAQFLYRIFDVAVCLLIFAIGGYILKQIGIAGLTVPDNTITEILTLLQTYMLWQSRCMMEFRVSIALSTIQHL